MILGEEPSLNQLGKQIYSLSKIAESSTFLRQGEEALQFTRSELALSGFATEQPLVITAIVNNFKLHRILVDTGACKNILYFPCFTQMGLTEAHLKPYAGTLEGFTNHRVTPKGTIDLKVIFGEGSQIASKVIMFLILDLHSNYNAIFGTPALPELAPYDKLEEISVHSRYPEQKIKIGRTLSPADRAHLIDHLSQNLDIFA